LRTNVVQTCAAAAVGALTASEEYRVLMEACAALSPLWYERLPVVAVFAALYGAAAYALLAAALHAAVPVKSWSQYGLTMLLSFLFGAVAVVSAPTLMPVLTFFGVTGSAAGVAVAELASYPNVAGAILGSFVFMLVCLSLQELRLRSKASNKLHSEA
jgi:hypothetical protein